MINILKDGEQAGVEPIGTQKQILPTGMMIMHREVQHSLQKLLLQLMPLTGVL